MSVNTGPSEETTINVRVSTQSLNRIDELYEVRSYTSRSEVVRDVLRDWVNLTICLSEEVLKDLAVSREQRERDEIRSLEE